MKLAQHNTTLAHMKAGCGLRGFKAVTPRPQQQTVDRRTSKKTNKHISACASKCLAILPADMGFEERYQQGDTVALVGVYKHAQAATRDGRMIRRC